MSDTLPVVLLLALPASGKSETRKYLGTLSPEECRRDFHMGATVQLDDYPYVHLMRRIDDELAKLGRPRVFFHSPEHPFQDAFDWGTLIELLNEDFDDLLAKPLPHPGNAASWLFGRMNAAALRAGAKPKLAGLPGPVLSALEYALDRECRELYANKIAEYPDTLQGKTVVIEFARGGADGSSLPLAPPFGYQYSLGLLSKRILSKAAILYVWVTPEESRRKNYERTDPNDPGSILNHGVPIAVMMGDYGCDDMGWLVDHSDHADTIQVEAHGRDWHIPVARFDNRQDKTTFVRSPRKDWTTAQVSALHEGLRLACERLAKAQGLS